MNNIYTFNFMIISMLLGKFIWLMTVHSVIFDVHSSFFLKEKKDYLSLIVAGF